jgi:hypothetical protein
MTCLHKCSKTPVDHTDIQTYTRACKIDVYSISSEQCAHRYWQPVQVCLHWLQVVESVDGVVAVHRDAHACDLYQDILSLFIYMHIYVIHCDACDVYHDIPLSLYICIYVYIYIYDPL